MKSKKTSCEPYLYGHFIFDSFGYTCLGHDSLDRRGGHHVHNTGEWKKNPSPRGEKFPSDI